MNGFGDELVKLADRGGASTEKLATANAVRLARRLAKSRAEMARKTKEALLKARRTRSGERLRAERTAKAAPRSERPPRIEASSAGPPARRGRMEPGEVLRRTKPTIAHQLVFGHKGESIADLAKEQYRRYGV